MASENRRVVSGQWGDRRVVSGQWGDRRVVSGLWGDRRDVVWVGGRHVLTSSELREVMGCELNWGQGNDFLWTVGCQSVTGIHLLAAINQCHCRPHHRQQPC